MKPARTLFPALCAAALLLAACAGPSDLTDPSLTGQKAYTDPATGIVLPPTVGNLQRVSLNPPDSHGIVRAHYTSTDKFQAADTVQGASWSHQVSLFLQVEIVLGPKPKMDPQHLIASYVDKCRTSPNSVQEQYPATKRLGGFDVLCAQCTYDRPAWSDRSTSTFYVMPVGDSLLVASFSAMSARSSQWEATMDNFVQSLIAGAHKPGA